MKRQLPTASSSWPMVGASTGTIMKMIIAVDMICAIAEPWKRSRTMATTSTRDPAAAMPCSTRAASSSTKLPATALSKAKAA